MKSSEILQNLGLGEKEQLVYITGASNPPLPVSVLAKRAHVSRTQCYEILRSLEEKSLCSNMGSEYGKKIQFAHPKELFRLYETAQQKLREQKKPLEAIVSKLASTSYAGPMVEPKVQFARGIENLRKMFWRSLDTSDSVIYSMLFDPDVLLVMGYEFMQEYVSARLRRKISSKSLSPAPVHDPNPLFFAHEKMKRKVRYVPASIKISSTILMFDNHVLFITTHEEPFGTLIESADFASTQKSMFETLWELSSEAA
jgi:sugar-specific transcriptional regulator TrmB